MNQREEIAGRIKGLREASGTPEASIAEKTGISVAEYRAMESGATDAPMSWLSRLASFHNMEITSLLTGSDPHSRRYHLTRRGTGPVVERRASYHYESLAAQFAGRSMEPFMVTVEPDETGETHLNSHPGQEFDMVTEGRLRIYIDSQQLDLERGDSLYFDSSLPHGMAALDGKRASFLAIITA